MPAKANRRARPYLWAAALAALAPSAFAQTPDNNKPPSNDTAPPLDEFPDTNPWARLISACAQANIPLATVVEAPRFASLAYVEASPHALAVRYGAPLAAASRKAAQTPYDPWIAAEAEGVAGAAALEAPKEPPPESVIVVADAVTPGAADADVNASETDPHDVPLAMVQYDTPLVPLDAAAEASGEGDAGEPELIPIPDPLEPQAVRHRPGQAADAAPTAIEVNPNAVAPMDLRDLYSCEPALSGQHAEGDAGHGDSEHLMPCAPPVPDRWRLAENLGVVHPRWWDPYNQNTLKGDRPIFGTHDWFFIATAISDTVIEPRRFPIPMGVSTTERAGSLDVFGDANSLVLSQTFVASAAFVQGQTAFKPQELEFRIALAGNINYAEVEEKRILYVRPDGGTDRLDSFVGVQELFVEDHLRNVSDRYDFDSLRVGIQPFSSDFRGFLFQDNQLGVRLFGTRNNNRLQYNLAAFARLEKDTNSGLNDISDDLRKDYVFLANVYRQDTPVPGMTSQLTAVYNMNREQGDIEEDTNGFPVRPALIGDLHTREYDVGYVGYNADGHIGRMNLTASAYYAFGEDRNNVFTGKESVIRSYFVAVEPSIDFNWIRVRGSALYGRGDEDPYDDREEGFDAIFENPQFAGADTSYWIRQSVPFIGGGRAVNLNGRNGILNSLRSSKEQGQSNFINPGIALVGIGADADVTPELRVSANVNHLSFATTAPVEALRMQGDIDRAIGWDVSAAATYRPGFIQNFVFRLSAAALAPEDGFKALFDNKDKNDLYYSVLFNATVSY